MHEFLENRRARGVGTYARTDKHDELRTKLEQHMRQCIATWLSDEVRTPSLLQERVG